MENESIWYYGTELRSDHKRFEYVVIDLKDPGVDLVMNNLDHEGYEYDPDWQVGTLDCRFRFRRLKIAPLKIVNRRMRARQGLRHDGLARRIKN